MFEDQSWNVSNVVVKAKEREADRVTVLDLTRKALSDLTETITDPTTVSVNLTATILGGDNTISIENIIVDHNQDLAMDSSLLTSSSVSWKHTVPQTIRTLYDDLASNLNLYVTAEDGPVDSIAITGIAIGDPSLETLLKSQNQSSSSSIVDLYIDDDEIDELDD